MVDSTANEWPGGQIFESEEMRPGRELQDKYRHLFLSGIGVDVLADLLTICHFGSTLNPDNSIQISEYNVGVAILARCGILGPQTKKAVIRALCSVVPDDRSQKEEE